MNVPRVRAKGNGIVLHTMSAAADYLELAGWKCYTTTRSGAQFHVGLYDSHTGALMALVEAERLGQLRTGADDRPWPSNGWPTWRRSEVGLFGTGWQAQTQLEAVAVARPIKQAFVYSRDEANRRETFAGRNERAAGDRSRAGRSAAGGGRGLADRRHGHRAAPCRVFDGNWLAEGTMVAPSVPTGSTRRRSTPTSSAGPTTSSATASRPAATRPAISSTPWKKACSTGRGPSNWPTSWPARRRPQQRDERNALQIGRPGNRRRSPRRQTGRSGTRPGRRADAADLSFF